MRLLKFKQVDVFTRTPFSGNPVAVVLEAQGLGSEDMQRIAAWTNLSETTFVLPPGSAAADYRLREEKGVIEVKAPRQSVALLDPKRIGELEQTLGAKVQSPPRIVNVGPVWLIADLGSADAVDHLVPDMAAIGKFADSVQATGFTVFGATGNAETAIHVRSFAPTHGVPEDPVCGSGNISVAAFLRDTGQLRRYGSTYQSRQGMQLGRDGRVSIRVEKGEIFLGGSAVTCIEGTLRSQAGQ